MTNRPTLLLSGFEPFGGSVRNASWDAVEQLAAGWDPDRDGARLVTARLAVAFGTVRDELAALIAQHAPDVVIAVGEAGGDDAVRLERVAINLADARLPDNAGQQPRDEPVRPGGARALFSTLPVKAAQLASSAAGIEVRLSLSAGSYVCNAAMFHLLELTGGGPTRAGFVHVPADGDAGAGASALRAIALAVLGHVGPDAAGIGGELS